MYAGQLLACKCILTPPRQWLLLLAMRVQLIQAPPLLFHLTLPCNSQAPTCPFTCSLRSGCQARDPLSRQVKSEHAHARQGSIIGSEGT